MNIDKGQEFGAEFERMLDSRQIILSRKEHQNDIATRDAARGSLKKINHEAHRHARGWYLGAGATDGRSGIRRDCARTSARDDSLQFFA